jgi:uncharacterized protein YpmS
VKIVQGIFITIGIIAVLFIIFVLIGYLLYSLPPDIKSEITTGQVSADAAKSFNTKVTDFKDKILEASAKEQKIEVSLTLSEIEINSKIIEMIAEEKLPFRDMEISLNEDLVWLYFEANYEGMKPRIGIVGKTQMVKNDLEMDVLEFQLGKLPLPQSVDEQVEGILNILIKTQSPINELPADLKSVVVSNGTVTLKVQSRPAD